MPRIPAHTIDSAAAGTAAMLEGALTGLFGAADITSDTLDGVVDALAGLPDDVDHG